MPATAWRSPQAIDAAWAVFAAANLAAMALWPTWETIPFHFIWVSLTLVYGFRIWPAAGTALAFSAVAAATGAAIFVDALSGTQLWGELFEVPLMGAMFLAMVWHAQRRRDALAALQEQSAARASLLDRQERFLHDASHELRTPVTIARGHLELLGRQTGPAKELDVALDELARIERIVGRLLLLANADQPDFLAVEPVDVEAVLEDVFLRWSEVAARSWRLDSTAPGTVLADPESLRTALDALLENAVKYTEERDRIELRARGRGDEVVIEVADEGRGVPAELVGRIFDRFARAEPARGRADGGVGLGLAIVDAIAKAHGGACSVQTSRAGSTFSLLLPEFRPAQRRDLVGSTTPPV